MPGTNAVALKAALHQLLVDDPQLAELDVQVLYGFDRSMERRVIYLGRATADQAYATMGGRPRLSREENLVLALHIEAWAPGSSIQEADEAAVEVGTVVEELLAAAPAFAVEVTGLISAGISSLELEPFLHDDGIGSHLTYELAFKSRLR